MLLLTSIALASATLLACHRYGVQRLLLPTVLASLLLAVLVSAGVGCAPLMGYIAAIQIERRRSYGKIIGAAAVPGAAHGLFLLMTGRDITAREAAAERLAKQLQDNGLEQLETPIFSLQELAGMALRLQPGIEFVSALFVMVLAYRISWSVAGPLSISLPAALPLRLWRIWEELIWVLVAGLALGLMSRGLVADLAVNLLTVMLILYAVQGVGLVRFYFWRLRMFWMVEMLFYVVLLFASGMAALFLAGLGLLDTWFDWRRLRASSQSAEGNGT
jgi:hypothetical protein